MHTQNTQLKVMVTGATGGLGSKLVPFLQAADWCAGVVAVDRDRQVLAERFAMLSKVERRTIDLSAPDMGFVASALQGVDAIVHFAILNPLPDSSWSEAAYSFDMTARLLLLARDQGLQRFVFTSSNHALGNYGQEPLRHAIVSGGLTTELFAPGSKWDTAAGEITGYAYGAGKIFGERLCLAAAKRDGLSTVAVRIGWCQAGENHPSTLDASGNPNLAALGRTPRDDPAELRWFRNMWLSNRDFLHLMERALLADADAWPSPGIVVNGMSANRGMGWDIDTARRTIGYLPQDNVWDSVLDEEAFIGG